MIRVLDHGYIRTANVMGGDIDVVNAARVSFNKEVDTLQDRDEKLIEYLVKNRHDAVFRHCAMTFEIYAPLMVARQWYKHAVASTHLDDQLGWNETSRRYVTENEEFYIPNVSEWRGVPDNKKQGSDGVVDPNIGAKYLQRMRASVERGVSDYRQALQDGVAPEQARLLLPAYAMYIRWRWTASLNALLHFVSLRKDAHAQYEIQQYAQAVFDETQKHFPITTQYWLLHRTASY
jgi:thymidylate synthase (FAD)